MSKLSDLMVKDDIKIISKKTGGRVGENDNLNAYIPNGPHS